MKRIIIVNNNMKVGGVQKSLYNLLWTIDTEREYDVTLLLFSKTGAYVDKLPTGVKVIESAGPFRYLGVSQGEVKGRVKNAVCRGFLATMSRVFGRELTLRFMSIFESKLKDEYDCAISFLHNGRRKAFYGGAQDYVLRHINAKKKIAFLHGDYLSCGADHKENNRMMRKFDVIAACSDGCRASIESALPELRDKCTTVRNCHRFDEIKSEAEDNPLVYDDSVVNTVIVARLSHEKGIDRAIDAVANANEKNIKVKLHVVGGGPMLEELKGRANDLGIANDVIFYGEQSNPFRYMKNADLLLISSYHEAAPMVIDEALSLGIPILTTETTSSEEMVTDEGCGWVCENTQKALNEVFIKIASDKQKLCDMKNDLLHKKMNNVIAIAQFYNLIAN